MVSFNKSMNSVNLKFVIHTRAGSERFDQHPNCNFLFPVLVFSRMDELKLLPTTRVTESLLHTWPSPQKVNV